MPANRIKYLGQPKGLGFLSWLPPRIEFNLLKTDISDRLPYRIPREPELGELLTTNCVPKPSNRSGALVW